MTQNLPIISIITPTLNAAKQISQAYERIADQDYPKDKIELIIADGGSTDNTLEVVKKFGAKVYPNPLKTSEAGKAVALKKTTGEYILLLDSDNYVVGKDWLRQMVAPLIDDPEVIGSEPLTFSFQKTDGYITRYTALMGMGDPLMYFLGAYDRTCLLSGKWTGLPIKTEDKGDWLKVELKPGPLPTIGANGTLLRRSIFDDVEIGDYLFDIDVLANLIQKKGKIYFAKTKNEIIHAFSSTFSMFVKKQRRRIRDYFFFESLGVRKFPWKSTNKSGLIKFLVYTVLIIPTIGQSFIGFLKKPDSAWFFHPIACWSTLLTYFLGRLERFWRKPEMESREGWKQG